MRTKRKSFAGQLVELAIIVVVALGLAFGIQRFIVKPYRIPSPSMEPTLDIGQRVLVNRIGNRFSDPHVGEIIVFHPPKGAELQGGDQCGAPHPGDQVCTRPTPTPSSQNFIKRVVAGPGDRIRIVGGHVIRNGRREADSFTIACGVGDECNFPRTYTVPRGHWFVMGDNRGASDDSRYWGPVPRDWIIGGAFATYWPVNRIGLL